MGLCSISYPPQSTSGGAVFKGSDGQTYFVPGAVSASTTTTTTSTTTTTTRPHSCGDNDNDVAPRSLRFHHGTIRIHHYDYGSQHPDDDYDDHHRPEIDDHVDARIDEHLIELDNNLTLRRHLPETARDQLGAALGRRS